MDEPPILNYGKARRRRRILYDPRQLFGTLLCIAAPLTFLSVGWMTHREMWGYVCGLLMFIGMFNMVWPGLATVVVQFASLRFEDTLAEEIALAIRVLGVLLAITALVVAWKTW